MAKVNKHEVHCETCGWVNKWSRSDLIVCPNNPEHILTDGIKQIQCEQVLSNSAESDPGVSDDISCVYGEDSVWINTLDKKTFTCVDATEGSAVWKETTMMTGTILFYVCGQDEGESGTTGIEWQDKFELELTPSEETTYIITWMCEIKSSELDKIAFCRLIERDGEEEIELSNSCSGNSNYKSVYSCTKRVISSDKKYVIQYKSSNPAKTAYIRRAGIRVDRLV